MMAINPPVLAEAVKKRLISEGYPKEVRAELVNLIWAWIHAPNMEILINRQTDLIDNLRRREADYLVNYYGPREHHFVRAYTRLLPNLRAESTQRTEGMF